MSDSSIRIIVFPEGDQWIGQCLEHDICSQAPDLDTLRERLLVTIEAERGQGIEKIPPAPDHFFSRWEEPGFKLVA